MTTIKKYICIELEEHQEKELEEKLKGFNEMIISPDPLFPFIYDTLKDRYPRNHPRKEIRQLVIESVDYLRKIESDGKIQEFQFDIIDHAKNRHKDCRVAPHRAMGCDPMIKSGGWIFGRVIDETFIETHVDLFDGPIRIKIDPETICVFTEEFDQYDTPIYTRDILKGKSFANNQYKRFIGEAAMLFRRFCVIGVKQYQEQSIRDAEGCAIIGNSVEHPYLVKTEWDRPKKKGKK